MEVRQDCNGRTRPRSPESGSRVPAVTTKNAEVRAFAMRVVQKAYGINAENPATKIHQTRRSPSA